MLLSINSVQHREGEAEKHRRLSAPKKLSMIMDWQSLKNVIPTIEDAKKGDASDPKTKAKKTGSLVARKED